MANFDLLQQSLGERLKHGVPLHRYTSARVGGPADWLAAADSRDELVEMVTAAWEAQVPFLVLGGGSNVLVSDRGVSDLVILNRARRCRFSQGTHPAWVWAESGANFGGLARQAARRGLGGLEWAAGVPGSLGGAVVGNAGAHGGDLAGSLILAEILHHYDGKSVREEWPVDRLAYTYRSSCLKNQSHPLQNVVLSARLALEPRAPEDIQARMDEFLARRRRTQPPGASLGSMFKNPVGDYAGRLIEAAGLKGARCGHVQISPVHANFFVNDGKASASDTYALIQLARQQVAERFGVTLELEIELIGDWN